MDEKALALRLAKNLTAPWALRTATAVDAAAELLRLHDENERLTALLADVEQVEAELAEKSDAVRRLRAVNAELLEALKFYGSSCDATESTPCGYEGNLCCKRARAAIARAEGEKG